MSDEERQRAAGAAGIAYALQLDAMDVIGLMAQADGYRSMTHALLGHAASAERLRRLGRIGIDSPPDTEEGRQMHAAIMAVLHRLGLEPVSSEVVEREMNEGAARILKLAAERGESLQN